MPAWASEATACGAPATWPSAPPAGSTEASDTWTIDGTRLEKYRAAFNYADSNKDGFVEAAEVEMILGRGSLTREEIQHIWRLADADRDGRLSLSEFACASHLAYCRNKGTPLPNALPMELTHCVSQIKEHAEEASPGIRSRVGAEQSQASTRQVTSQRPQPQLQAHAPPPPPPPKPQPHEPQQQPQPQSQPLLPPQPQPQAQQWQAKLATQPQQQAQPHAQTQPHSQVQTRSSSPQPKQQPQTQPLLERLNPEELKRYVESFEGLKEAVATGFVGQQEGRDFLEQSGLPVADLAHIWRISDVDRDQRLSPAEFVCAMALVTRRLKGEALPAEAPREFFQWPSRLGPSEETAGTWDVGEEELSTYRDNFQRADPNGTGRAGQMETKELMESSGLPTSELRAIHGVADLDKDGRLSLPEFLCAMAIIRRRRAGAALPKELPAALVEACYAPTTPISSRPKETASPVSDLSWQPTPDELQRYRDLFRGIDPSGIGTIGPDAARAVLESSKLPIEDLSHIWDLSDAAATGQLTMGEFICALTLVARRRLGHPLPDVLPQELVQQLGRQPGSASPAIAALSPLAQSLSPQRSDFEDMQRYCTLFRNADAGGVGSLGPEVAWGILQQSQLPTPELSQILRISDADRDGKLSMPEFLCAMVLAVRRRQGMPLPSQLPPELAASASSAAQKS